MTKYYSKTSQGRPQWRSGPATSFYSFSAPDQHGISQTAEVELIHGGVFPNFEWDDEHQEYYDLNEYNGGSHTLFDVKDPKIEFAWTGREMQHTVPTLLAIAANRARGNVGVRTNKPITVMPSEDLSPHSSRLVKRLTASGVIPKNPKNLDARVTNQMQLHPREDLYQRDLHGSEVPKGEVEDARYTVRRVLNQSGRRVGNRRANAVQKQGPKPEQLRLF